MMYVGVPTCPQNPHLYLLPQDLPQRRRTAKDRNQLLLPTRSQPPTPPRPRDHLHHSNTNCKLQHQTPNPPSNTDDISICTETAAYPSQSFFITTTDPSPWPRTTIEHPPNKMSLISKCTSRHSRPNSTTFPELPTITTWLRFLLGGLYGVSLGLRDETRGMVGALFGLNVIAFLRKFHHKLMFNKCIGY
jgi:hypothetical protein